MVGSNAIPVENFFFLVIAMLRPSESAIKHSLYYLIYSTLTGEDRTGRLTAETPN